MEYNLQNKQITEKILSSIDYLLECYVCSYQIPPHDWGETQIQTYLLNCDAEVQYILEKNQIELHDDTYCLGITFGILIIKKEIIGIYSSKFGKRMPEHIEDGMWDRIHQEIFKYIIRGTNKNGN